MTTIQQVQAAVKSAPHYRVNVGALEVIGAPGRFRWTFDYIVRKVVGANGITIRAAYGKRNAVDYLATLPADTAIVPLTFEKPAAPETVDAVQADHGNKLSEHAASRIAEHRAARKSVALSIQSARDNSRGVLLICRGRDAVCSVVPYLVNHRAPDLREAGKILAGESIPMGLLMTPDEIDAYARMAATFVVSERMGRIARLAGRIRQRASDAVFTEWALRQGGAV